MSNINNLYTLDTVEDLSQESAATIQGGILVTTLPSFRGTARLLQASPNLTRQGWNDNISSIRNNTRQTWAFYTNANFTGSRFFVRPGQQYSNLGGFDNRISSMRSV